MRKVLTALLVPVGLGGGIAAALALAGRSDPRPPEVSTVKVKQPTQTVTEQDTVTVDPGTLTVEEAADEDDAEQIEAVLTTSVPDVDESSINDVKVEGDKATAKLADGRQVSLSQQHGDWEPRQVERAQLDGAGRPARSGDQPRSQADQTRSGR